MNNLALAPLTKIPISRALMNLAIGVFLACVLFLLLRAVTKLSADLSVPPSATIRSFEKTIVSTGSAVQTLTTIKSSETTTPHIQLGPGFPEYWH